MQEPRPYRVSCREVAVRPGRAEHVQHTRDALPQAAHDLLAEKGHAGTGTEEIAGGEMARAARHWIGPFRDSFRGFRMEITDLIGRTTGKEAEHVGCGGRARAGSR
jgi:hypothetical protein